MVHRFLKFTYFIKVFKPHDLILSRLSRFTDASAIIFRIRFRGFAATPLSKAVPDFCRNVSIEKLCWT